VWRGVGGVVICLGIRWTKVVGKERGGGPYKVLRNRNALGNVYILVFSFDVHTFYLYIR